MIIDSKELIEKIIKEIRTIRAEMMIAKSIHTLDDEKQPESLEELMKFIVRDAKASNELVLTLSYNEGKFDAYLKMLDLLGFQYKEDETE